jgi:hypothetical protein
LLNGKTKSTLTKTRSEALFKKWWTAQNRCIPKIIFLDKIVAAGCHERAVSNHEKKCSIKMSSIWNWNSWLVTPSRK